LNPREGVWGIGVLKALDPEIANSNQPTTESIMFLLDMLTTIRNHGHKAWIEPENSNIFVIEYWTRLDRETGEITSYLADGC